MRDATLLRAVFGATCACGLAATNVACGPPPGAPDGAAVVTTTLASDATVAHPDPPMTRTLRPLTPQYRAGLRIEASLRTSQRPWGRSHTLDVRLTNTEDAPKRYVSMEKVTLGHQVTYFRPPPLATLGRRGSWVEYPAVASWDAREPPIRILQPLVVTVRYEGWRGGVVVPFQWDVWLEPPD